MSERSVGLVGRVGVSVSFLLGALAGCGGGTPSTTGGAGTSGGAGISGGAGMSGGTPSLATPSGFCAAIQSQYAIVDARCYGGTVTQWDSLTARMRFCGPLDALLAKHTIAYDPAQAATCLATLKTRTATECSVSLDCIDQALAGLVADGGNCTHDAECRPGVSCWRADDTTCDQEVCTPPGAVGAPCTGTGCVPEGFCDNNNMCQAFFTADVGGDCTDTATVGCKSGLTCLPVVGSPTGARTCQTIKVGGPCEIDFDCPLEQFCGRTMTCTPRIAAGAPCTDDPTGCLLLGACDPVTNRCVQAGLAGRICGLFGFCVGGFCDGVTADDPGTCAAFLALGKPCVSGFQCLTGVCRNNLCTDCPR